MYKKALSLMLASALFVSLLPGDISPKISYADTIDSVSTATSSNAKKHKDNGDDFDEEVRIASDSNASRKENEEDITIAASPNVSVASGSNATIATSSEAKQKVFDFSKAIKGIKLLKQDDYSVVSKDNPIYSDESLVLQFEYKLKSSIKKNLEEGKDIVYEYQLPEEIVNLIEDYDNLVGEIFTDAPDSEELGYIGEFCNDGQVTITLLSTDEDIDELEKLVSIPLVLSKDKENLPDKISFTINAFKKITVYFYTSFDYEETIDGVTIHITDNSNILPKSTMVKIAKVSIDDEFERPLRGSIEGFKKDETIAFDISFWDGDDEVQIKDGSVKVSFIYPELPIDGDIKVFHIDDNQNLEIVPTNQEGDEISFEANHFSVYGFTTSYVRDTNPLGNPLIGGTTSGDWNGNYVYFGWEGLESNKNNGDDNWLEIKDYINNDKFYRLNGQLYSGADLMTPVRWRILNNNGSALLLLSDEMLDVYNYGTVYNDHPTWETSDIRRWLNDEFMANHFTPEEQNDIKESTVTDIVSSDSNLPEGNTTEDKIFLPSKEELTEEEYGFPTNGESLSRKTAYNNDSLRARNTANDRSYWTRSRGDLNYTFLRPVFVTENGLCGYGANRYCSWILGVRPMLRLDLDSQRYGFNKTDSNLSAGIKFDKSTLEMKVGDVKDLNVIPINIDDNLTSLKWISTTPSVVSIGFDGKLSALSNGTANIYAIQGQYIAMCRVTVKENPKQQYKVTFKDGDTVIREIMVEEGTAATAPVIVKEGYTLSWDNDFSRVTEDIIINAVWSANTYNIIYEMNGGINHYLNPVTYTTGGSGVVFQKPTFVGYVFEGWYTTSDFKSGTEITLIPPNNAGDVTVYAKWNIANYKITYNLNGGTNNTLNPNTYKFGDEVTLKDPIYTGNIFKGWYTTPDFENTTQIDSISSGNTGDITVYAKWELKNTQNGGSNSSSGGGGGSSSGSIVNKKKYIVNFINDGNIVKTEEVEKGKSATAPVLSNENHIDHILSWDKDYSNIQENMEVNAKWTPCYYWPVPSNLLCSRRFELNQPGKKNHAAIDIEAPKGAKIYAVKSGTIKNIFNSCPHENQGDKHGYENPVCGKNFGCGNGLYIHSEDDNIWIGYAHMKLDSIPIDLKEGSHVVQGQLLGEVGSSGVAYGPHLHLQIRKEGNTFWSDEGVAIDNNVESLNYIYDWNSEESYVNYMEPSVTSITASSAKVQTYISNASSTPISVCGLYWGEEKSNLIKISEVPNGYTEGTISYELGTGKWSGPLTPNTMYYYQFYTVINGKEYKTNIGSFVTKWSYVKI